MLLQATAKVKRVIAYRAVLDDKGERLKIIAFSPHKHQIAYYKIKQDNGLVRLNGLEPSTPTMSRWCSNQLSYERNVVGDNGDEY